MSSVFSRSLIIIGLSLFLVACGSPPVKTFARSHDDDRVKMKTDFTNCGGEVLGLKKESYYHCLIELGGSPLYFPAPICMEIKKTVQTDQDSHVQCMCKKGWNLVTMNPKDYDLRYGQDLNDFKLPPYY